MPAAQPVHLDLASAGVTLKPGTTYHFRVIAAKAIPTEDTIEWGPPTVLGGDQAFTTLAGRSSGRQVCFRTSAPCSPLPHPMPPRRCRKGFHKKRVNGTLRCVRKHHHHRGRHRRKGQR
jgi:hypothetical protein